MSDLAINWTFGIVTDGKNPEGVSDAIQCILLDHNTKSKGYYGWGTEIIVIGGEKNQIDNLPSAPGLRDINMRIRYIAFDDSIRNGWITKKKNLIVQNAVNDNICIMHDYYMIREGWAKSWHEFGNNWNVAVNPIETKEGKRHSDWLINPEYMKMFIDANWASPIVSKIFEINPNGDQKYVCGLPYNVRGMEKIQYVSGGYMCVKKQLMQEIPFNECLTWGQDEDLEWSQAVNLKHKIHLNPNASVIANRKNKWILDVLSLDIIAQVAKFYGLSPYIEEQENEQSRYI